MGVRQQGEGNMVNKNIEELQGKTEGLIQAINIILIELEKPNNPSVTKNVRCRLKGLSRMINNTPTTPRDKGKQEVFDQLGA